MQIYIIIFNPASFQTESCTSLIIFKQKDILKAGRYLPLWGAYGNRHLPYMPLREMHIAVEKDIRYIWRGYILHLRRVTLCLPKGHLLQCKVSPFALWKVTLCRPLISHSITIWLSVYHKHIRLLAPCICKKGHFFMEVSLFMYMIAICFCIVAVMEAYAARMRHRRGMQLFAYFV